VQPHVAPAQFIGRLRGLMKVNICAGGVYPARPGARVFASRSLRKSRSQPARSRGREKKAHSTHSAHSTRAPGPAGGERKAAREERGGVDSFDDDDWPRRVIVVRVEATIATSVERRSLCAQVSPPQPRGISLALALLSGRRSPLEISCISLTPADHRRAARLQRRGRLRGAAPFTDAAL